MVGGKLAGTLSGSIRFVGCRCISSVPPLFAKWVLSIPDFLCGVAGVVADYTYIYIDIYTHMSTYRIDERLHGSVKLSMETFNLIIERSFDAVLACTLACLLGKLIES